MRFALIPAAASTVLAAWLGAGPAAAATLVVANKSDASADLVDLTNGLSVAKLPTGKGPHEVAVSPDGRLAVISDYGPRGEDGSTLTVIDVGAGKVLRTIDLGRGTLTSVREIVAGIVEEVGPTAGEPRFGELPVRPREQQVEVNVEEAAQALGWRATTGLEAGLRATVAWFRSENAEQGRATNP